MEIINNLASNDIGYLHALKNAQPLPPIPRADLPATLVASSGIQVTSDPKLPTWVWVTAGLLLSLVVVAVYQKVQIQRTLKKQQD